MRRLDVLPVASECGLVLFACSAALGIAQVHFHGHAQGIDYLVATGVPASAALAFLFVAFLFPSILTPGRIRYPVNLVAPMVYTALLIASVALWTTNGSSIKAVPETMRPVEIWGRPLVVALAAMLQVVALSIAVAVTRSERELD